MLTKQLLRGSGRVQRSQTVFPPVGMSGGMCWPCILLGIAQGLRLRVAQVPRILCLRALLRRLTHYQIRSVCTFLGARVCLRLTVLLTVHLVLCSQGWSLGLRMRLGLAAANCSAHALLLKVGAEAESAASPERGLWSEGPLACWQQASISASTACQRFLYIALRHRIIVVTKKMTPIRANRSSVMTHFLYRQYVI